MTKKEKIKNVVEGKEQSQKTCIRQSYKRLPYDNAIPPMIYERRCEIALQAKYGKDAQKKEDEGKDFVRRSYMDPPYNMGYCPTQKTNEDKSENDEEKTL